MEIQPIAHIETPFSDKFGIPRQSGLVPTPGRIVFAPPYRFPEALRGIEGYSHLWLIFDFSHSHTEGFRPTVRPPRLGGNTRMGVFATRSPFRPNALGLSCVRLLEVQNSAEGPVLLVEGADLLNGTPIYDIKPYLPFADSKPDAVGGFADEVRQDRLQVQMPSELCALLPEAERALLCALLAADPRPSYQNDEDRVYHMEYGDYHLSFSVQDRMLRVLSLSKIAKN